MRLGVGAALVAGALVQGDMAVEDGRITGLGLGPAGAGLAVPGFVDLQVNGFAGVDFLAADGAGYAHAREALAATGVTAFVPTFVSSPLDVYPDALATVGSLPDGPGPRVLGVHLEGPFISPRWTGAHDPAFVLAPDAAVLDRLCDAGPVRLVTLAPELPGGLALVERLAARGIAVSAGHSDADADAARAAFEAGVRAITHVYNAHRRWAPRDPGLAGVALVHPAVTVQTIVDGVHLAAEVAAAAFRTAGARFCLVTDAVEAAGLGPGTYRLGPMTVAVANGRVELADGTLAGSVLTMDAAVRNLVTAGASVTQAVHAATRAPAALLGAPGLGVLRV
ncbi:MAG: nagA, partial [Solirubrobacterales bacterium]|nr:nagA [Solirubrobacterales bacterium]